jgi:hypothetical protein
LSNQTLLLLGVKAIRRYNRFLQGLVSGLQVGRNGRELKNVSGHRHAEIPQLTPKNFLPHFIRRGIQAKVKAGAREEKFDKFDG